MKRLDTPHHDPKPRTWAAITVMLAQMQNKVAPRNLPIQRRIVIEPMIPIDRKAEITQVEFVRLANIKYTQDRDDGIEADVHGTFPFSQP